MPQNAMRPSNKLRHQAHQELCAATSNMHPRKKSCNALIRLETPDVATNLGRHLYLQMGLTSVCSVTPFAFRFLSCNEHHVQCAFAALHLDHLCGQAQTVGSFAATEA